MEFASRLIEVEADLAAFQDEFEARGWTDGLPVIPPTPELVAAMIAGSGLPGSASLGRIGPRMADVTVERAAINAVMAGCRPVYMPVIAAALRALANPAMNTAGFQGTTHPVAAFVWVNGPIRQRIGLNCGTGIFGPGFRANATIGRAVRLVLMNIAGGLPAVSDMATHGTPAKFSFCGGENEEDSPWAPLHVDAGFAPTDSTVTVFAGDGPTNVNDHDSTTAEDLLPTIADSIDSIGINNVYLSGELVVVLCPEHATILAQSGLSKRDVRDRLWQMLPLALSRINEAKMKRFRTTRASFNVAPGVTEIPLFDSPEQIVIVVGGGAGKHSLVIPGWGASQMAMEKVLVP